MNQELIANIRKQLIDKGIADHEDVLQAEQLEGGVSCEVWKIRSPGHQWVYKQALGKLKVEADWFSDIERIHREHEVMEALHKIVPRGTIPKVVFADYDQHFYLMSYVQTPGTWKDLLMTGNFDTAISEHAGFLLKCIHERSPRVSRESQEAFCDQTYFVQLRIDPFHRFLVQKYPDLLPSIENLIDELTMRKICLVHGDFSPKNMLVTCNKKVVLLDFEVAHWGNPVFDLAYCIGHLMLKGWYRKNPRAAVSLISSFLMAYGKNTGSLIPHLGLMLLARIDGKSPVNYIKDDQLKNKIRKVAIDWINRDGNTEVMPCIQQAFVD